MKKIQFILVMTIFFLSACKKDTPKTVEKIYKNRIDILQSFENISIDQRGDLKVLTFHCDSLSNTYVFEKSKEKLNFIRDTTQFDISKLYKSYLEKENAIPEYLLYYLTKLDEYNIKLVSSEFLTFGITLKLYLRNVEVFYVADTNKIINPNWIKYLKTAHKLDEYWYWKSYLSEQSH